MNRLLLHLVPLLLLLALQHRATGQDFPMMHYTVDDGLPSNTIYEIYRDSRGFLWIGTDKGVTKYNGIKFETATTFNGLPDNEIFFTQEDYYGRIWFGTLNGELCYYKDDTFHTAANTPFLKLPSKAAYVKSISVEKDSTVSFTFFDETFFINADKNKCTYYKLPKTYNGNKFIYDITGIEKVSDDEYDIICLQKIVVINGDGEITRIDSPRFSHSYNVTCQNNKYYRNEDIIYDREGKIVKKFRDNFFHSEGHTLYRFYMNNGSNFMCTNKGLFVNDTLHFLEHEKISSITQDNYGNYWVSTLENGLYIMPANFINTRLYKELYDGQIVNSTVVKNRLFYTTSDNSLFSFNNSRKKCLFDYNGMAKKKIINVNMPASYLDSNLRYYNFYNDEHIVIDNVLENKKIIKRYTNKSFLKNGIKNLNAINDVLYFQCIRRIIGIDYNKLKPGDDIFDKTDVITDEHTDGSRIFYMTRGPAQNMWYSTINNVYKIADGKCLIQPQFKKIVFKFFGFYGKYLVGCTPGNQLIVCSNFNNTNAIKADTISLQKCIWDKFYPLDSTHILIATNNLYRLLTLYPGTSRRAYSISTIENPFIPLRAESICADSSNCYFFKNGSVTSIDIKSLLKKPDPPILFFTAVRASNRYLEIHDDIEIPYDKSRNITISFSNLSFIGSNISYQYSVSKNGSDNWRNIVGNINLVNPNNGDYIVKLRAKTMSSSYCVPVQFKMRILRPYWSSWWFMLLCICLGTGLVWIIIRLRIKTSLRVKEKEHESEVKFMKSEYKALNALMNPHFIFNTLNNVQGLVNRNDKAAANEYLRVFADLIRQNMHNISKELITLQREITLITNYLLLEKLRFKDLLNYKIIVQEHIDLSEILIPPLLVQPLVENAIKHGILPLESTEGTVIINIYERMDVLYIEIKNNGLGIGQAQNKKDSLHESFGLANIRKRIEQLSIIQNKEISFKISEIKNDASSTQWTIVTIGLPITE